MSSSDPHEAPQEEAQPGEQDERDSIIGSSLLEPPMSRRPRHPRVVPHPDLQIRLPSVEGHAASHDASMPLATIPVFEHVATPSLSMHPTSFSDRPHNALVTTRLRSYTSTSNAPPMLQAVVYHDGYAPVGSLPPQNFVPPPQSAPSSGAPFFPPPFHGSSFPSSVQVNAALSASISGPSAVIPPNSELALPPRFTFAPAGADVPADPVATASTQATPMNTRRREKETRKLEMTVQTQAESTRRPRSNSWNVVSSVFRRKSGRHSGPSSPATATADVPQLTASDWRGLAQWAHKSSDNSWGEGFEEHSHTPVPVSHIDAAPVSSEPHLGYEQPLPPLPTHLSHLLALPSHLGRPDTSKSSLNPFLAHRPVGLPPLSWDLRNTARDVFFPAAGPIAVSTPMPIADYAQPATWPPCGALRIGAIGGRAGWLWPVEAHNPMGVRCGDLFRALIANLNEYVRPEELATMPRDTVKIATAACEARVSMTTVIPLEGAVPDGIKRVDCLLGSTLFYGLEPGPSSGEWTMYVGVP